MELPERINASWVESLADADLVRIESQLHDVFNLAETEERRVQGGKYSLTRGSAELMLAWQRWNMVSLATRARGLHARYRPPAKHRTS